MTRFRCCIMKFCPGVVPQWPSSMCFTIRQRQRPLQQRIVEKVKSADREVVRGAPVGVHLVEQSA